jgi:hypothetical protein
MLFYRRSSVSGDHDCVATVRPSPKISLFSYIHRARTAGITSAANSLIELSTFS